LLRERDAPAKRARGPRYRLLPQSLEEFGALHFYVALNPVLRVLRPAAKEISLMLQFEFHDGCTGAALARWRRVELLHVRVRCKHLVQAVFQNVLAVAVHDAQAEAH
jgi:hypothetical protein